MPPQGCSRRWEVGGGVRRGGGGGGAGLTPPLLLRWSARRAEKILFPNTQRQRVVGLPMLSTPDCTPTHIHKARVEGNGAFGVQLSVRFCPCKHMGMCNAWTGFCSQGRRGTHRHTTQRGGRGGGRETQSYTPAPREAPLCCIMTDRAPLYIPFRLTNAHRAPHSVLCRRRSGNRNGAPVTTQSVSSLPRSCLRRARPRLPLSPGGNNGPGRGHDCPKARRADGLGQPLTREALEWQRAGRGAKGQGVARGYQFPIVSIEGGVCVQHRGGLLGAQTV